MIAAIASAVIVGYLPGAVLFRLPIADRDRRAALAAEERVFWHVVLSLGWSLALVLAMAAAGVYRFDRLLIANVVLTAGASVLVRGRLRLGSTAAGPTWTLLVPIALLALAAWRFQPPSEYIIGGKDPGVYVAEGIQIAKRGSMLIRDEEVAGVPAAARNLFFPSHRREDYYGIRFMGFFIQDPAQGTVIGQFPHLYPASIAIGYDVAGVRGALATTGVWAVLGILAVYFAAARLVGRTAAAGAALLLSFHVIELWYSRYPNAEVVMQALLFAALLAFARAHQDGDRFFGPVAGGLCSLLIFLRVDALIGLGAIAGAALLVWIVQRQWPRPGFLVAAAAGTVLGLIYLAGPMRAYFFTPLAYLGKLPVATAILLVLTGAAGLGIVAWLRARFAGRVQTIVPLALATGLVALAVYAQFFRKQAGLLAVHDAYALRTFTDAYLSWPGLLLTLAGVAVVMRRLFWRDPALMLVFAAYAVFFFYKIHVVPEHFWMARRFLPVILPGALLFAAAAAVGPWTSRQTRFQWLRVAIGAVALAMLGRQYAAASAPIRPHVEYAGMIQYMNGLSNNFTDRDLVIVESRDAGSDVHVLAMPLAYVQGRRVLVLASARPNKRVLEGYLQHALDQYHRVFFVGGGGTDLLSRRINAIPVADQHIGVPEYDSPPWNEYPAGPRRKDFDYSVYELSLDTLRPPGFVLDIGYRDDLNVVRFHAKEETEGRRVRWTGRQSFIAVPGMTGAEREVRLVMHDGGRPRQAGPAEVEVFLDDTRLGTIAVQPGWTEYVLALPGDVVAMAARSDDPAVLRLLSTTWSPNAFGGGSDTRALGVMIDKVEIR